MIYKIVEGQVVEVKTRNWSLDGPTQVAFQFNFPLVTYHSLTRPSESTIKFVKEWIGAQGYTVSALQHIFCSQVIA